MIPSTMASPNGTSTTRDAAENSLEKIKRQLASASGKCLLQGPLLKRSETLRKWNERWVVLDPTTGRMEYKVRRNEPSVRGTITFDANSTITLSPVNFHGLPKYDGCSFYIGTPSKKDYFFCAETSGAARAWVSTLLATQLVLRAHREAVNSLSGNGSKKLGTVAAAIAAANSTALECSKEIEAAMQVSMRNALGVFTSRSIDGPMDDFSIMKETLRVKDEELQNLARDIRARDSTIKDIAEKLTETAEAAEAAASAARLMDDQRRKATKEFGRLTKVYEKQMESLKQKVKDSEEKVVALNGERDQMVKQRETALQEAHLRRSELAKARERAVILEAAVVRAEEKARVAEADAESRKEEVAEKEAAAANDRQELVAYMNALQAQLQRHHIDPKHVNKEMSESCSDNRELLPLTKHMDLSEENVDKACLIMTTAIPVSEESFIHMPVDHASLRPSRDGDWNDIQATELRIEDLREIAQETGSSGMDIPVISQPPQSNH